MELISSAQCICCDNLTLAVGPLGVCTTCEATARGLAAKITLTELDTLRKDNKRLRDALEDAMDLISRAAPLAWLFHEPDGGEYHKTAGEWEKDAEKLIARTALKEASE